MTSPQRPLCRICGRLVAKLSRNDPKIPARRPHGPACIAPAPFATRSRIGDEAVRRRTALKNCRTIHRQSNLGELDESVKTSAIALALSAMLAGPVLAQGASSDTHVRGGAQGKTNMQGGMSGSGDEEIDAQAGAAGGKGRREKRHQGYGRRRQRCAPRVCQDHGRGGYRSYDRPISTTRKQPVSSVGLLSKQNSGCHGRPEFFVFCVLARAARTERPAGRLYVTRTR